MGLVFSLVIAYCSVIFSDYIIHKKILHGQWKIVKNPHPFFRMWLYPHYISHLHAHHVHVIKSEALLVKGQPVPRENQHRIEQKYKDLYWVHWGLICSDHGFSIRDVFCLTAFLSLFALTPHYYVSSILWIVFGPTAGILSFALVFISPINSVIHRFYHMDQESRRKLCPPYLRWYVLNWAFDIVARQHQSHHYDAKHRDDYYNLLPFGNFILRPFLGKN